MSEVTVVEVPPQLVLGMRKRGKYEMIATMIPQLCRFAVEKGLEIRGRPTFVCHERSAEESIKANEEGTADVEVVIPVSAETEGSGEIQCYELPGGTMARTVHKGPYPECTPAYKRLFAWLAENGKRIAGPTREVYMNDPRENPPEELLTEIYAPIE
jgi:effector-binding domain-containing protein